MGTEHISSGSFQEWRTPPDLARSLIEEYELELDAAATILNRVCTSWWDPKADGLEQPWLLSAWCNPPYAQTAAWLAKGREEVFEKRSCTRAVFLLPAAVGVEWFTLATRYAEVHLFDERIKFVPPPYADLTPELQEQLYRPVRNRSGGVEYVPKTSPGGGNALVILEEGGLVGVTGMRSAKTGRFIHDFISGERFPAEVDA